MLRRGAEAPLMSGSGSPPPPSTTTTAATTTLNPSGHTQTRLSLKRKTSGDREAFLSHQNHVYPFCSLIYKGFNGGHLHKVCRRLRCSMCQMRAALRRARGNNAKSPPPALLSPAPFGTLPCPPVRGSKEGGRKREWGRGGREG